MGRIRSIKPEFPQSESMGNVSRDARLLFIQLWTLVDDSGRARGSSRMLASLLFPYDDDAPALIGGWLGELQREGCVELYEVDGARYVWCKNFLRHQKIDKATASKLPEYTEASRVLAESSRAIGDGSGSGSGSGSGPGLDLDRDGESEGIIAATQLALVGADEDSEPEGWAEFWEAYPSRVGKRAALKSWRKLRPSAALRVKILTAVAAAKKSEKWTKDRGQYIPNPATWLNQGRWDDEVAPAQVAAQAQPPRPALGF